ncbi:MULTISPECIES: hypothetical protein [unclassified Pseudomonas]|uniref:hypothetical protein n=1 Tax=unclassified Pseudomonas TaxID=196821 RepID=UPI0011AF029A|nr:MULTISPECIES: hypothetical protein [unclassified Pseudomonas]
MWLTPVTKYCEGPTKLIALCSRADFKPCLLFQSLGPGAAACELLLADCCPSRTAEIGHDQPLEDVYESGVNSLYSGGFNEIVTSLNEDINLFHETDVALTAILEPLWLKFGWTVEGIEAKAMRYRAELNTKRAN